MQLLQQIVSGKSNSTLTCIATAVYNGTRYLAYGSGAQCIIYTADHQFVQALRNPAGEENDAVAVAINDTAGTIAVAFKDEVLLFAPQQSSDKAQWSLESTLKHEFMVHAVSWNPQGQLLVAGQSLIIWERKEERSPEGLAISWNRIWTCRVASEVIKAAFSPDGYFFATFSDYDRFIKVWYKADQAGHNENFPKYEFVYLPHPRSVLNMEWRRPASKRRAVDDNVLMSLCRDNVCRLWSPISATQPIQYHLGAIIDPADFPLTENPSTARKRHICSVHWLNGEEVQRVIKLRESEEMRFLKKNSRRKPGSTLLKTKKLKEVMKDYPDMLFHVQSDGSMVIWGIQHLTSQPRRMVKVFVIMKTDNTVPPADFEFFQRTVLVYQNDWNARRSSIFFPAELQLLGQRPDGVLHSYTLSLDDFFATSWMIPHLSLTHSWGGHRKAVKRVVRHPNLPYMASISTDGEVIVFHMSIPQIGLRTTEGLSNITSFPPSSSGTSDRIIVWLPHGAHLILEQEGKLSLLRINSAGSVLLGTLDGYDPASAMTLVHPYFDPEANTPAPDDGSPKQTIIHVLGVGGGDHSVYVWVLRFEGMSLQRSSLISKTALPVFNDEVKLLRTLPTDDLCAIYYPYTPVGAHLFLTYSTDRMVRFWHCANGSLASIPGLDWADEALREKDENPWRIVAEFSMDDNNVTHFDTDPFGKIGVVRERNGQCTLAVLGNEATGLEMKEEWSTELSDYAVGLDWYFSSDGQHLLAVAMPNRVNVYCQKRLLSVEDMPTWEKITDIEIPWTEQATAISWLINGSLLVATTQKVLVYEKWIDNAVGDLVPSNQDVVPQHIFTVVDTRNGRMPDHHPQHLIQYLLWGKFDFVRYSLSLLYTFIKMMVDGGKSISETPMPLWKIFAEDEPQTQREQQYDALFDFSADDGEKEPKVGEFGEHQATYLTEQLARVSLPNISNVEQMSLLAVIDTFIEVEKQKRSLDENGVRYVLSMRFFLFSQKSFPPQLRPSGLISRDFAWAFFSESQDILLDLVTQAFNNKLMWRDAKALGMGYWLRNPDSMRRTIETIARNQYMGKDDTRNPVDCSLFYMALRKKNVLLGLWKLANAHPEQVAMLRFLNNDFEEERWKSAALKNAFALLGKQRYEYAVAFFLLADKLKDAVSVCLKQLDDPQLAIIICRLYEGEDGPILKETVSNLIIPKAVEKADRWLASIAFTVLKQRDKALFTTLMPLSDLLPPPESSDTAAVPALPTQPYSDPALLVFYHHLRRSYRTMRVPQPRIPLDVEYEFIYRSAQAYERLGCPGLALDIIRKADTLIGQYVGEEEVSIVTELKPPPKDEIAGGVLDFDQWGKGSSGASGAIDWSEPSSKPATLNSTSGGIDWGERISKLGGGDETSGGIDWGEPVSKPAGSGGGIDWSEPVSKPNASSSGIDWGEPISSTGNSTSGGGIDWGEPVAKQGGLSSFDDEFEAFKKSLGGYGDDNMNELELQGEEVNGSTSLEDETGPDSTPVGMRGPTQPVDEKARLRLELEKRNIRLYNWLLAMRLVQAVYRSAYVVSKNRQILSADATLRDYFTVVLDGTRALCDIVAMPVKIMDAVLSMRCREMDAVVAYVEIMPLHGSLSDYKAAVETFIVEECNTLVRLALQDDEARRRGLSFVESMAKQMFWLLVRWHERTTAESQPGAALNQAVASQAAATAFLTLSVCCLRAKKYQLLYWLVGLCDRFFDALLANKMEELKVIIVDLLSERPTVQSDSEADPGARTDIDSEPDEADFEDGSPLRQKAASDVTSLAELLVIAMAFQHIGLCFDSYLAQLRRDGSNPSADETHGFLCDAVLRKLSRMLFDMQRDVARQWGATRIRIEKIRKYLEDPDEKELWSLLRKTVSVVKMLEFILQADDGTIAQPQATKGEDSIAVGGDTEETPAEQKRVPEAVPELIYRTKDIIHTFAINPLDHKHMSIGTHGGIQEVDIESALHYFQRRGTFTDLRASVDDIAVRHRTSSEIPPLVLSSEPKQPGLKKQDTLARNLSFDSMQKALKKSMHNLRRESSSNMELNAGQGVHHNVSGVSSLASHPTLNYYLAGISEPPTIPAVVQLYQFGQAKELVTYTSGATSRFTRCRFDPFGARFGASDTKGDLYLWRFDASPQALAPAMVLNCHSFTNDFTFLSSSTLLATAGVSNNHQNVCLWDTLLPTIKARVKAFTVAEGGAYSLVYSHRYQLLFSGGRKGEIYVFDTRQGTLLDNFNAHEHIVKALAVDDENNCLVSGSTGGEVKLWDLQTFKQRSVWSTADKQRSSTGEKNMQTDRAGLTAYGVMQIEVIDGQVFTCGVDGCVRRFRSPL